LVTAGAGSAAVRLGFGAKRVSVENTLVVAGAISERLAWRAQAVANAAANLHLESHLPIETGWQRT